MYTEPYTTVVLAQLGNNLGVRKHGVEGIQCKRKNLVVDDDRLPRESGLRVNERD